MKVLGSGRQGVVYNAGPVALKVSPRDLSAVKRGENQPALVEYKIHAAVQKVASGGVPKVIGFSTQKDFVSDLKKNIKENKHKNFHEQSILTMEKIKGVSIRDWVEEKHKTLTDAQVMRAVRQVLATLRAIAKKYPNFRHNDLHLDNVMIVGGRAKIIDFGWARLARSGGNNPAVNTAVENGTAGVYGIGPRTDARYDSHLFLKEMRTLLSRYPKFKKTMARLDMWVPVGYRGFNDRYTREGRLKYGLRSYPGLPKLHNLNAARPTASKKVSKSEPTGLKTLM